MSSLSNKLICPATSLTSSDSACKFQPHKISSSIHLPRRTYNPKIACKSNSDDSQNPNSNRCEAGAFSLAKSACLLVVALISLGGLYGVAISMGINYSALYDPIQTSNISDCHPPRDLPPGSPNNINCCPPVPPVTDAIRDFKLPPKSTPLRFRPAAHAVDTEYMAKYTKAVELMKALPDDDPRSFKQQANVHCAYCSGIYDQVGYPDHFLQIHSSWLFLPWHRFYLYFHERILAKLIGDDTFALPFWNWDAPAGMQLPAMYTYTSSSLYHQKRDARHQRPFLVDLDYDMTDPTFSKDQQIDHNLKIMYRQMISNGKTPELFMGSAYRAGDQSSPGVGALEDIPHNTVHVWTGDRNQPNAEDMGTFYSAARDPIFYAHHTNLDRLWYVWKTLGENHQDFTDPDWLNATFHFYDENKQLIKVKVKDCLDHEAMRYTYQDVDIPWRNSRPTPKKAVQKMQSKAPAFPELSFPVTIYQPVTTTISRPKVSRSSKDKADEEEVLFVEGIELEHDKFIKFDVYINATVDDDIQPNASEFAGSFVHVPYTYTHSMYSHGKEKRNVKTVLKLAITDLLEDIGAEDDDTIFVTLVPRSKDKFSIGGIRIAFLK